MVGYGLFYGVSEKEGLGAMPDFQADVIVLLSKKLRGPGEDPWPFLR
jgi:hypothetical protein